MNRWSCRRRRSISLWRMANIRTRRQTKSNLRTRRPCKSENFTIQKTPQLRILRMLLRSSFWSKKLETDVRKFKQFWIRGETWIESSQPKCLSTGGTSNGTHRSEWPLRIPTSLVTPGIRNLKRIWIIRRSRRSSVNSERIPFIWMTYSRSWPTSRMTMDRRESSRWQTKTRSCARSTGSNRKFPTRPKNSRNSKGTNRSSGRCASSPRMTTLNFANLRTGSREGPQRCTTPRRNRQN